MLPYFYSLEMLLIVDTQERVRAHDLPVGALIARHSMLGYLANEENR